METTDLENMASLIGEPVRARMLWSLLDGRAYTATELSLFADTSPQNASMHLSKLVQADLLKVSAQGRHRYYSFARDEVAYAIEALANLVPPQNTKKQKAPEKASPIKHCRTCYDHLAGKAGVMITDSLLAKQYLQEKDNTYTVSPAGQAWFAALQIDITSLQKKRRVLARPCLDWSERRYHLAGTLGAALLSKMLEADWVRSTQHSRAIVITGTGQRSMYELLGVTL
ncbi:MAG TPA: winged helix-turn-helix domain-containing protein [Chitinophaga sp.]|uniref:ArsR/SmtB family transcription factor n=1 Tax=Chitinophaga sp. TaxID=1869181 RepID=UPI002F9487FC